MISIGLFLVAGLHNGQEVVQTGVDQFALCWVGGIWERPAFYIREKGSGREWVLLLEEKGENVWNHAAVDSIVWR